MYHFNFRITALLIFPAAFIYFIALPRYQPAAIHLGDAFSTSKLEIPLYEFWDLGVADIDSNGAYDIFTVNHSARQAILLNNGKGVFTDRIDALGLGQDPVYNNVEDNNKIPEFTKPGLYIYRKNKKLNLVSWKLDSDFSVTLHLPWPVHVVNSENVEFSLNQSEFYSQGQENTRLDVTFKENGKIIVLGEQTIVELPHRIEINSGIKLTSVFIGQEFQNPIEPTFTLHWRDRHSMAWIDIDNNGTTDVLIARGGVKGQVNDVLVEIEDQILLNNGKTFNDESVNFSLNKGKCPARQTAWVDHDNDGSLDVYISCGRGNLKGYPNHLYSQIDTGKFVNIASETGLDFDQISVFKWLDTDRDGDIDLIAVENTQLVHYVNINNKFRKTLLTDSLHTDFSQIITSDFDQDGYFDLYAVSRIESTVIKNDRGSLSAVSPTTYGLPTGSRSASWIDFDNDGILDLHTVPQGIYRQSRAGRFQATGLLGTPEDLSTISQSRCSWFDSDNNGSLDAVCATQRNHPKEIRAFKKIFDKQSDMRFWTATKISNLSDENNWLQVELTHHTGIAPDIGAVVSVNTNDNIQYRTVGEFEGSHYSQGNYRVYFGLGKNEIIDELIIFWTDGTISKKQNIKPNQLLQLSKNTQ